MNSDAALRPPDGFWYVCNASRFQVGNLLPLRVFGLKRCVGVLILVGASKSAPAPGDEKEALAPAELLVAEIKRMALESGRPSLRIEERFGNPHDEDSWNAELENFLKTEQPRYTVYNLTGGTRSTVIGGMMNLMPIKEREGKGSLIRYAPPTLAKRGRIIQSMPRKAEMAIPTTAALSMETLGALSGYRMQTGTRFAKQREAATEFLVERIFRDNDGSEGANRRMRVLHITMERMKRSVIPLRLETLDTSLRSEGTGAADWLWKTLLGTSELASNLGHLKGDTWTPTLAGRDYFKGLWFEEHVYWIARRFFPDAEAEVHTNVRLSALDAPQRNIDVAIVKQSQLHIIECKAQQWAREGGDGYGIRPNTMRQLAEYRQALGAGAFGRAVLVSAHDPQAGINERLEIVDDVKAEAERLGLATPIFGPDWRRSFEDFLKQIP